MEIDKICILGGTGFVGKHLVDALTKNNKHVTILTRNLKQHQNLEVPKFANIVETDVYNCDALHEHFKTTDCVINLVGILNERGYTGAGFRKAHVELTRLIISACENTKARRYLHMSALHASHASGPSFYLRSKG